MIRHGPRATASPDARSIGLSSILLAVLLFWAPLPFGSAPPAFAAPLAIAVLVLCALSLALDGATASRPVRAAALAAAAIAALGWLQSLEWPAGLVERLSPEHAELARQSAALVGAPAPGSIPLSLAPGASRFAALLWLLPAAALLVAARAGESRTGRRRIGAAIAAAAVLQVLVGAQHWLAKSNQIWGVETPNAALRLRGTFVNPNHLALGLEIALAVAVAWLWWSVRRASADAGAEHRLLRVGPPALVWAVLFAGLGLTGSRAGWLAALAGILVTLAVAASGRSRRWTLIAGAAGLAVALGVAAGQGSGVAAERLLATGGGDASVGARLETGRRALELWRRFPLVGAGLGGFRAGFPLVQGGGPGRAPVEGLWRHAHDDWVELGSTTGVLGVALFGLGLAAAIAALARARRRARRGEERAAVAAAAGALAAAGLHSLVDFGLTQPANALALAAVVGAACAVGRGGPEQRQARSGGSGPAGGPETDQPPEETADQPVESPSSKPSENSF